MSLRFTRLSWPRAAVALCVACCFCASYDAQGHARVVKAQPADKSELTTSPHQIELWFNELLDEGFNSVEVFSARDLRAKLRTNFAGGEPKVDAKDRTHLSIPLKMLPAGEYVVEWRVLSRDGHSAPGRLTFRVSGPK